MLEINKDKYYICCYLCEGMNLVDGYWNGREFISGTREHGLLHHISVLDKEKSKAEKWMKVASNDIVPDNNEIQIIPAIEYEEEEDYY
jgi:hypothetical protein